MRLSTSPVKLRHAKTFALLSGLLAISGCSTLSFDTAALTEQEVRSTVATDKAALVRDVEPLTGPLTLEGAVARAIKYNAEGRYRAMEEAVASGTFEVGKFDMLPKLIASAGYRGRDKELISRSEDSVTGEPSLANPYISSSREAITTDVGISWSLLDFGQSYYAAKQNADRVFIAAERRRKAQHNLIQEVRSAYWRVVAAQKLLPLLRTTIANSEAALKDAQTAENEKIRSPLEPLRYQRQLLENLRLLEMIDQELSTARVELAALTNLPLASDFTVVEPASDNTASWLNQPVEQLEQYALLRNPDVREGMYNARIAQEETRRTLLKLFPGIAFNYGYKTSDDDYLINRHWTDAGVQISYNLMGLLAAPAQMRLADAGVALADQRRMATQMVVLTQLHIARLQYANASRQLARAEAIAGVDERLEKQISNQAEAAKLTPLDRVSQQSAAVLSQLRLYQALSNNQAAASRLQATLGLEPTVSNTDKLSLTELTNAVGTSLQAWNQGQLPATQATP